MKEEWKVYIKGVPERGEEVIKALTDLGAENPAAYEGKVPNLYYIGHDGNIHSVPEDFEIGKIIMDNYHEIKLPEKWRDGDVLIDRHDSQIMVLYEFISDKEADLFNAYVLLNGDTIILHSLEVRQRFRLATEQEIERFYEILHEHHKDWDAEKKQLVDWRWKPKESEKYWVVITGMGLRFLTWHDNSTDKFWFSSGNCFRTKEEAEAMAEKINKLLKGEDA